ncbi:hypothetical protein EMIHUDRAFT_243158 [Emiliania huxleyi CCMP1516]|nr:hypothetical protein EMIHUDRAFT_243158 [Emiliania huxleyi CCMP1516]EOD19207.1 hypothetical protein EMIHUDRAFT_243158 [Emiliania huxleyi CCMP1516]|eukprot:XP_005771636.1 hypothetical protein EMIHUDRAFT_243158 [Emiliania huxleyi CCMP1516]
MQLTAESEKKRKQKGESQVERRQYNSVLGELESSKLYGQTPKMFELDQLANMLRKGRLNLFPKYQRDYVWKPERASRLVVTVLCNRIVPGVVLHEKEKGVYDVVDGKQRLTSLLCFYMASEDRSFLATLMRQPPVFERLSKLDENYEDLNGLSYSHLSRERQFALQSFTVSCTIIPHDTPRQEVFAAYEDINSGGEDLKAQQLRRAAYFGAYIELLDKLATNLDFQYVRDPRAARAGTYTLDPKESDREMILRAFAFNRGWQGYIRPVKTFLNLELESFEELDEARKPVTLRELEEEFCWVLKTARQVWGPEDAFARKWEPSRSCDEWVWSNSVSLQLWDVMYSVLAELRLENFSTLSFTQSAGGIVNAFKRLFERDLLDMGGQVTVAKFAARRDLVKATLKSQLPQPLSSSRSFANPEALRLRCFSAQLGACAICGQPLDPSRLHDGTYAHLDHRVAWARGGRTTAENAQLVHAGCNLSKGAGGGSGSACPRGEG